MAVTVQTELMALGGWSIDLNWSAVVQDLLTREDNGRRVPRKVHLIISRGGTPIHPPLPLLRYTPSDEGIQIGGRSALWWLGSGDIGPVIVDREYVSGANKLGNPSFDLDDLYWRRPAEGSLWVLSGGTAVNVGGYPNDDPLESDEKFPTRPGYSYRLDVLDIFGTGRLRQRILFEGQFTPPNLWVNGDLQDGTTGWGASTLVEIVNDPANAYGDQSWVMRCAPIPQPQYIADPNMLLGGGAWIDDSAAVDGAPGDIQIVNNGEGFGGYVMQVGPCTQKQLVLNPGMEDHTYWYENTAGPTADPSSIYYVDVGMGMDGTNCLTTNGDANPAAEKYLRAQFDGSPGVTPATVVPGEEWELETHVWAAPGTTGRAFANMHIPHPTVANRERYYPTQTLEGERESASPAKWNHLSVRQSIPANRFSVNVVLNVMGHDAGYWHWDNTTLTRRGGNRARLIYASTIPVDSESTYRVAADVQSYTDQQSGTATIGAIFTGPGQVDSEQGENKGSTDYLWHRVFKDTKPPVGYTAMRPFVSALDIIGQPMYVDMITVTKIDNNRAERVGATIGLTPERTYSVRCKFRSGPGLSRGNARLRMRLTRAGYPDVLLESTPVDATDNEWRESQALSVTPPSGYDTAVPSVVFTDVEGDFFYAAEFLIVDNDTSTVIVETVSPTNPAGVDSYVEATAPEGAEWVRALVVAEAGSANWTIGEMTLARIGVSPATGLSILQDLVTDPDTGDPLPVSLGAAYASDPIPYDWRIVNLTAREALDHLCSVIYEPPLEYYVYQSFPPSLIVGPAATIFTDHLPTGSEPVLYRAQDIDVAELPSVEVDVEDRPTKVRVLGAVRKTVSGRDFLVTAEAAVPGTAEVDFNGRPVNRTLPISDASVDHIGYAEALAADLASKLADPPLAVTAKLHPVDPDSASLLGLDERPEYRVGDWIYVHSPEHGLTEDGYEVMVDGEEVNPRRMRVIGATQEHGPQYEVLVRKEDGTIVPLPGVLHSEEDSVTLTLGDRPLEWVNDPQGGAAGPRYLRDRRAMPR